MALRIFLKSEFYYYEITSKFNKILNLERYIITRWNITAYLIVIGNNLQN